MVKNINDNLEEQLDKFTGKSITIEQNGFLASKFLIKTVKYFIQYEILNILDEESENYIKLNLNQIYKIDKNTNDIKLYLDNDLSIILKECKR